MENATGYGILYAADYGNLIAKIYGKVLAGYNNALLDIVVIYNDSCQKKMHFIKINKKIEHRRNAALTKTYKMFYDYVKSIQNNIYHVN